VRGLFVLLAACGAATPHAGGARDGSIAGLARDHDSGDPIAKANIHVRADGQLAPLTTLSSAEGIFGVDHLAPGRYSLSADFAGQQVVIEHIDVRVGAPTVVDVVFTLGQPDPVHVDFNDAKQGAIDRFRPKHHPLALIEGTVNDAGTRTRVAGAVVTAIGPGTGPSAPTLQAVSDDMGRYRFDPVPPGTYIVSAYYSIGGRGQFEMRRSEIEVGAAEGVIVPLWVETAK
jgi:hypothetical protein